jgi:hypothetical protein
MVWLNSDELVGKVTRTLFKTIQEYLSTPHFPGEKPLDVTLQRTRNKYYYILGRLNTRCLNIRTNIPGYSLVHTMTVPNDALLHEILPEPIWKQAKDGLKRLGVNALSQLRSGIRPHLKPSSQLGSSLSKAPKWFNRITEFLTDSLHSLHLDFRGPTSFVEDTVPIEPNEYVGIFSNKPTTERIPECYTDGSLFPGSPILGCAAVFHDRQIMARISRPDTFSTSSSTAELGVLLLAMQNISDDQTSTPPDFPCIASERPRTLGGPFHLG